MNGKSVSLSDPANYWVKEMQEKYRTNFSKALNKIILEHRGLSPAIRKREALLELRAASMKLSKEHDIETDAIVSWVKEATGLNSSKA